MNRNGWQELVDNLRGAEYRFGLITPSSPVHRVEFDAGLTDAEVVAVEHRFGFQFPPDLREFLQIALPRGPQFPDWRSSDEAELRRVPLLACPAVRFSAHSLQPQPSIRASIPNS